MKKIETINENIRKEIINTLYLDEVYQVFPIYLLENSSITGELYIDKTENKITSILHLKYDGNSYFTNFYAKDESELQKIAIKLSELNYKKILLAGKYEEVQKIMNDLDIHHNINPNLYYQFDNNTRISIKNPLTRATKTDLDLVKPFLIDFFDAKTKKEIDDITNSKKLEEELEIGIYLYKDHKKVIGMGRFSSYSKNYADITTIYIKPEYRKLGHGKALMKAMIDTTLNLNKIPVTQTAINNVAAKKTYESLGFQPIGKYAFEFIS